MYKAYFFTSKRHSMKNIVYYVALFLAGFIRGTDGDRSGFVGERSALSKYLTDLQPLETTQMG